MEEVGPADCGVMNLSGERAGFSVVGIALTCGHAESVNAIVHAGQMFASLLCSSPQTDAWPEISEFWWKH